MITIHDLMGNGCCTNPYTDFAIVNIKTGEVLVDRVHDKTYTVDDNKDYDQFLAYEWKTVRAWEAKDGKMRNTEVRKRVRSPNFHPKGKITSCRGGKF